MRYEEIITSMILSDGDRNSAKQYLAESDSFDPSIMHYHDDSLKIWRSVSHRYVSKEVELNIPYSLAENPKLYALDALCVASPIIESDDDLKKIAELFTVFYVMIHFFDDHVEHQDKFFSKFDFSPKCSINTQHGAAPFSFLLLSLSIIKDILNESTGLSSNSKLRIQNSIYDRMAAQTNYFTLERQSNLSIEEVIEMKARRVNGDTMGILADILREYKGLDDKDYKKMERGLLYLGSLAQFTDDIRDFSVDRALRNANLIISAQSYGVEAGAKKVAKLYYNELQSCKKYLSSFYSDKELQSILSLPFYPFMVDKQTLNMEKINQ